MSDVVVLCPTRGRPDKAAEMVMSLRETAYLFSTEVILVVDDNDPQLPGYLSLPSQFAIQHTSAGPLWPPNALQIMVLRPEETGSLTAATNTAAARIWNDDCIIGHVGDDHRFRSQGWDRRISETLTSPGVAYGDDGWWHERLPTAAFLSSIIPRTLGWYALPTSRHYGIDDTWGDLGRGIGQLHYLPDVCIIQPGPGETAQNGDDIYWRAQTTRETDAAAYYVWRDQGQMTKDVAKLRAILG